MLITIAIDPQEIGIIGEDYAMLLNAICHMCMIWSGDEPRRLGRSHIDTTLTQRLSNDRIYMFIQMPCSSKTRGIVCFHATELLFERTRTCARLQQGNELIVLSNFV